MVSLCYARGNKNWISYADQSSPKYLPSKREPLAKKSNVKWIESILKICWPGNFTVEIILTGRKVYDCFLHFPIIRFSYFLCLFKLQLSSFRGNHIVSLQRMHRNVTTTWHSDSRRNLFGSLFDEKFSALLLLAWSGHYCCLLCGRFTAISLYTSRSLTARHSPHPLTSISSSLSWSNATLALEVKRSSSS